MAENKDTKTYVFDGTEVKKTGRRAQRKMTPIGAKEPKIFELLEITPSEESDGWKKWVRAEELYEII